MDGNLSRHLLTHTPQRGGSHRLPVKLHHLRHIRLKQPDQTHNQGDEPRRQAVPAGSCTRTDIPRKEQPDHPGHVRGK